MNNLKLRREMINIVRLYNPAGLSVGKSGNLSVRTGRGLLITPTGVAYDELTPGSIVEIDMDGERINSKLIPSSEWRFHRDIYLRRQEVSAVVHVHSPYATAIACTRQDIPALHYHIALVGGGSIRCAEYATFGTEQLSSNALKALDGHMACLLANHGQIALGTSMSSALNMAREVEQLARLYCIAKSVGRPVLLDEAEVNINLEKFKHYGQED